jgi:hypothetical protein
MGDPAVPREFESNSPRRRPDPSPSGEAACGSPRIRMLLKDLGGGGGGGGEGNPVMRGSGGYLVRAMEWKVAGGACRGGQLWPSRF